MKYTKEQIELWERMSQRACGLVVELFTRKEIMVIQDFIETAKADLAKDV